MPETAPGAAAPAQHALNPLDLALGSSGVVLVVLLLLVAASLAVWIIWFLKSAQLGRMVADNRKFEQATSKLDRPGELVELAGRHSAAPGARVVLELGRRRRQGNTSDLLNAVAKRAIAAEQQRASVLMPTLSSIASASPFIGLFGTVWGIMDAFLRIGVEKSASLPVVAPAIGEALIATAFGLVAAIPATIGYNFVDKRIGDLLEELSAGSEVWVQLLASERIGGETPAMPLTRERDQHFPAPGGA
jgi:biopolymer transport protein TolQ